MKWFVCSFSYYIFNIHSLPLPYSFIVYMVLREVIAWFTTLHYRYNLLLDCWQVPTLRRPNFEMLARYLDRMCNDGFVSWGYNAYINFSDIGNDFYSDVLYVYICKTLFSSSCCIMYCIIRICIGRLQPRSQAPSENEVEKPTIFNRGMTDSSNECR
jgi:hypothetical protein